MIVNQKDIRYNVKLDRPIPIECYRKILEKYPDWKKLNREIKLLSLINENKKIKFDVEDIKFSNHSSEFGIKSMYFILQDLYVIKLEMNIEIYEFSNRKHLMIDSSDNDFNFEIQQSIEDNLVLYFYVNTLKK